MKIGFFDSGLGGLTIMKAVAGELPEYDYEYYGDTANLPYGDRSEQEVYELTRQGVEYLFEKDCKLVVIACNTASAETLRTLQDTYLPSAYPDRRILGVIIPMVEAVVERRIRSVGLIATRRTVDSGKYTREFAKFSDAPILHATFTPKLVPLIEAGDIDGALRVAREVVDEFIRGQEIDGLILGCTHYTLLKEGLRLVYPKLVILSQDEIIPAKLVEYLSRHTEIVERLTTGASRNIHLTKLRPDYDPVIELMLSHTV